MELNQGRNVYICNLKQGKHDPRFLASNQVFVTLHEKELTKADKYFKINLNWLPARKKGFRELK